MKKTLLAVAALALTTSAFARDQIQIVGSSTVYPFATVVAETLGRMGDYKAPVIESTGSGGGMKMFCKGIGVDTPDFTNSSRQIKQSEIDLCKKNGVTPIERLIGFDGIAFANSKDGEKVSLTKEEIFKAVSKVVRVNGGWIPNPYTTWNQINPDLPNIKIDVLAPPPTSGTRDAFVELVMHKTCKNDYKMGKKGPDGYKAVCSSLREDGYITEVGENDNVVIMKLTAEKQRFGIFGFSFLDNNRDKVQGATINGVEVDFETIADGSYPISRPLYFYMKKEHVGKIPGMEAYDELFKRMAEPEGKLEELGLITK
jgi:phosphate transport system substrate-binding protein